MSTKVLTTVVAELAVAAVLLAACSGEATEAGPGPSPPSSSVVESGEPSNDAPAQQESEPVELTPEQQARLDARLRDAAWADDVRRARRLIGRGADVNAKDDTQQSAYLIATS